MTIDYQMFPEYGELISDLKNKPDLHFLKLFHKHNELDNKIINQKLTLDEKRSLKKEKLKVKDEIYQYLSCNKTHIK